MHLIAIAFALLLHPPLQATRVPGSSVSVEPPAGFTPASRFSGFERPDVQASIMVTEVPGPFASVTAGMNARGLATRGMTLLTSSPTQVDGKQGLLLSVTQSANGVEFMKWMLTTGDAKQTVMVVATFPKTAEAELSAEMRRAVLSTRWTTSTAARDPFEGLPFRVTPPPPLKVAGRMNNLLLVNESGDLKPQGPNAPMFIVGSSVTTVRIDDVTAFAEARARQTKLKDVRISRQNSVTIAGAAGHELVAEGTDPQTSRPVTLYQVLLPQDGGYVLMQGLIISTRAAELIPQFRSIAESFRPVGR